MPTETIAEQVARAWTDQWRTAIAETMEATGLSRTDALLYLVTLQIGSLRNDIAEFAHPTFREDCAHCIHERTDQAARAAHMEATRTYNEVSVRYMERAMKHLDEDHGEEWEK